MFDPALNLTSLIEMLLGIVGTTITAFLWPFLTIVVGPLQSIAYWLSSGG